METTPRRTIPVSKGFWLTADSGGTIHLGSRPFETAHGPVIARDEAEEWADATREDWSPVSTGDIERAARWMRTCTSKSDVIALSRAFGRLLAGETWSPAR